MLRSHIQAPKLILLGACAAIAVQACSSTTTDLTGTMPYPAFALTLGTPTLSLAPGGTASTSVKATSIGGPSGAITYTVAGAPTGLTASITGTNVPDSSTLTVTASASLTAGTFPIVVIATASGALPQQATVSVNVTPVGGQVPAMKFVATGAHTCALATDGAAYCWGYNAHGQLGNNETSIVSPTPVAVAGGLAFEILSLSKVEGVSCGLTTAGAAYCWGDNVEAQLGDGTTTQRRVPTAVAGGLTFMSLAVGNGHVCGIAMSGTAYCWGSTPNGAFGDGTVGEHPTPMPTAPGMTFQSIVAGSDYTCALTPAGAAYCWGLGVSGQLGDGNAAITTTPVAVSGGLKFRMLAAGGQTACGLTIDDKAYCWGQNFYGTLGDGTSGTQGGTTRSLTPVAVEGGLAFKSLSAGYQTMCGVTIAGTGYCWGYNFGAIGDGTFDHRSTPTPIAGGLKFQSVSSGTGQSCGVTSDNAVYCWGDNSNGELGDGTTTTRATPTAVRWP
jgi:alpha-tubulin suppressor-like RCC1 family protein